MIKIYGAKQMMHASVWIENNNEKKRDQRRHRQNYIALKKGNPKRSVHGSSESRLWHGSVQISEEIGREQGWYPLPR